jgi:cytochrome c553|tara:strand:- start:1470 stop:2111 length:642 start_codon:yes stop_codon:yes gene_type:complete
MVLNMTKLLMRGLFIVIAVSGATSVFAAGDPAKGKALYMVCATCHGMSGEGNQLLNAPVTGGQSEWYVTRQLNNYRVGIRGTDPKDAFGMQMRPMAMTLANDQAVADVAAYVASLKPPAPAQTIEGNAEAGKTAFVTCVACHGDKGQGNETLNAPKLVGQHDWYMVRQIKAFKSGLRGTHAKDIYGMQMRPMAMLLATDQQINDVAAYIGTFE